MRERERQRQILFSSKSSSVRFCKIVHPVSPWNNQKVMFFKKCSFIKKPLIYQLLPIGMQVSFWSTTSRFLYIKSEEKGSRYMTEKYFYLMKYLIEKLSVSKHHALLAMMEDVLKKRDLIEGKILSMMMLLWVKNPCLFNLISIIHYAYEHIKKTIFLEYTLMVFDVQTIWPCYKLLTKEVAYGITAGMCVWFCCFSATLQ